MKPFIKVILTIFYCILFSNVPCLLAEDYYSLLGISRSSTTAEIRRAFKNLALKQHPDKNKDDPQAHEKFTKLNKAYEVLKDEELRKKYDLYGEEGLKDNHYGEQYQSWDYYNQEFGIYDNDPEIVTLSHGDFEQSVLNSNDIWFINFYSPYCSHCHELAPTWRHMARELDGVIRIGAINCNDEWSLCTQQGIRGYPSLKLYPSGDTYDGPRTTDRLTTYVLQSIEVEVTELTSVNLNQITQEGTLPWIVCICSPDEDCLSNEAKFKLSAMLDNLANVGDINCAEDDPLCIGLGVTSGVMFYSNGDIKKGKGQRINSLDAKDILHEVLNKLPAPEEVTEERLQVIAEDLINKKGDVWLLTFIRSKAETTDLELRKLAGLLVDVNIGFVDCEVSRVICDRLYVHKYPVAGLFKYEGYEWHYGRFTAHDIAVFANEAVSSNVHTLGPADFPEVVTSDKSWFVDFFAPWCPPCMKLLPEFRKASKQAGEVMATFGTVDCTIHAQLCQQYNIQSYPTTVFYNQSVPHHFSGFHKANDIIDFIKDTRNPPVISLTPETFEAYVSQKEVGKTWLVDFYAPWCGPCMELAPTYRKLAKKLGEAATLAQVDCQQYHDFCQTQGINAYPSVHLYPHNSQGATYFIKHNGWRDLDSLYYWVFGNLPSKTQNLDYYTFYEKVVGSDSPWIVDFYAPWCGHCVAFAPEYQKLSNLLGDEVNAGKVNCDEQYHLCQDVGIQAYPAVKYFPGAIAEGMSQPIFGKDITSRKADAILVAIKDMMEQHNAAKEVEAKRIAEKKASRLPKDEF